MHAQVFVCYCQLLSSPCNVCLLGVKVLACPSSPTKLFAIVLCRSKHRSKGIEHHLSPQHGQLPSMHQLCSLSTKSPPCDKKMSSLISLIRLQQCIQCQCGKRASQEKKRENKDADAAAVQVFYCFPLLVHVCWHACHATAALCYIILPKR